MNNKINYKRFLSRQPYLIMTHLLPQIHFETNFLLATKVTRKREREKEGLIGYLSA